MGIEITAADSGIERAFSILEAVAGTNSRNEKEAILKSGKDIDELKQLLFLAYNPFKTFYVKYLPKKITQRLVESHKHPLNRYEEFLDLAADLSTRAITGNAALTAILEFLQGCTEEEAMWYTRVIQKDLKIGIGESTIQKVFKGLLPIYGCSLAHSYEKESQLPNCFWLEPKLDGMRIQAFHYNDYVILRSRNGRQVFGFDDVEKEVLDHLEAGYVYDGEIMSSSFNMLMTQAHAHEKGKSGILNIFDVVTIQEFLEQHTTESMEDRREFLEEVMKDYESQTKGNHRLNSLALVDRTEKIYKDDPDRDKKISEYYEKCLTLGLEGIMIKAVDASYQYKRTNHTLKLKPVKFYDLEVVELEEGKEGTKYEGMMGSAVVDYNGVKVYVGGGWSDEQRKYFWDNPNELIGKVIEVKGQDDTDNQQGTNSIRFPRVNKIRTDK